MVKNFYECAKTGGKIINQKLGNGDVVTVCYDKEGKTHTKKKLKKNNSQNQQTFSNKNVVTSNKQTHSITQPTLESLRQLADHFNNNKFN